MLLCLGCRFPSDATLFIQPTAAATVAPDTSIPRTGSRYDPSTMRPPREHAASSTSLNLSGEMSLAKRNAGWHGVTRSGCEMMSPSSHLPQNRANGLPRTRFKQSTCPKRCTAAVNLAVAHVMNQPKIDKVIRAPVLFCNHMMCLAIVQVLVEDGVSNL